MLKMTKHSLKAVCLPAVCVYIIQPTFTCSKLTIETSEQCVKYVQS